MISTPGLVPCPIPLSSCPRLFFLSLCVCLPPPLSPSLVYVSSAVSHLPPSRHPTPPRVFWFLSYVGALSGSRRFHQGLPHQEEEDQGREGRRPRRRRHPGEAVLLCRCSIYQNLLHTRGRLDSSRRNRRLISQSSRTAVVGHFVYIVTPVSAAPPILCQLFSSEASFIFLSSEGKRSSGRIWCRSLLTWWCVCYAFRAIFNKQDAHTHLRRCIYTLAYLVRRMKLPVKSWRSAPAADTQVY